MLCFCHVVRCAWVVLLIWSKSVYRRRRSCRFLHGTTAPEGMPASPHKHVLRKDLIFSWFGSFRLTTLLIPYWFSRGFAWQWTWKLFSLKAVQVNYSSCPWGLLLPHIYRFTLIPTVQSLTMLLVLRWTQCSDTWRLSVKPLKYERGTTGWFTSALQK